MAHEAGLYVGNSIAVEVYDLKPKHAEDFDAEASVTATVLDVDGEEVAGQTWPVTLNFVPDSDGVYRASLSHEIQIEEGQRYTIRVQADSVDLRARWDIPSVAVVRTE